MGTIKIGEEFNPYKKFFCVCIPDCIVEYPYLTSTEKLCLGRLYKFAGENGEAYPSQEVLAKSIGVHRRQIINILESLEKKQFIKRVKTPDRATLIYRFLWHPVFEEQTIEDIEVERTYNLKTKNCNQQETEQKEAAPYVHADAHQQCTPMHSICAKECTPPVHGDAHKYNHIIESEKGSYNILLLGNSTEKTNTGDQLNKEEQMGEAVEINAKYLRLILDKWQSFGGAVYPAPDDITFFTATARQDILPAVKGIHSDKVLSALDNFGKIISEQSGRYFWNRRISIGRFFARHLTDFLPENFSEEKYLRWEEKEKIRNEIAQKAQAERMQKIKEQQEKEREEYLREEKERKLEAERKRKEQEEFEKTPEYQDYLDRCRSGWLRMATRLGCKIDHDTKIIQGDMYVPRS